MVPSRYEAWRKKASMIHLDKKKSNHIFQNSSRGQNTKADVFQSCGRKRMRIRMPLSRPQEGTKTDGQDLEWTH